ncbi:hypothetical protein [Neptunicella sp. SCSIO 80796]|uniref:hypothetical protein n=1 Tax=Neptunicella plasticusilytica TaxID=3117012 RepID=UPI003A4D82CD
MDSVDEAQMRSEHFTRLAMENRVFDLPPVPPVNVSADGTPLCKDCDINIQARREIVPNTQRCTACQQDHDKRSRK